MSKWCPREFNLQSRPQDNAASTIPNLKPRLPLSGEMSHTNPFYSAGFFSSGYLSWPTIDHWISPSQSRPNSASTNMLCDICQKIFTGSFYGASDLANWRVHHESNDSLRRSAQSGCYICGQLCANSIEGERPSRSCGSTGWSSSFSLIEPSSLSVCLDEGDDRVLHFELFATESTLR